MVLMNMIRIRYPEYEKSDQIYIATFCDDWTQNDIITIWSKKPAMSIEILYTYVAEYCLLLIEKNTEVIVESKNFTLRVTDVTTDNLRNAIHRLVKLPGRIWPPLTNWPLDIRD